MMYERSVSRVTQGELLATKLLAQVKIADSWIEMAQVRLRVMCTAWLVLPDNHYNLVPQDIAPVKAANATALPS